MKKRILILFITGSGICSASSAQQLNLDKEALSDTNRLVKEMAVLAKQTIGIYKEEDERKYLANLFRLQMLTGEYSLAIATIDSLRFNSKGIDPGFTHLLYVQYEL